MKTRRGRDTGMERRHVVERGLEFRHSSVLVPEAARCATLQLTRLQILRVLPASCHYHRGHLHYKFTVMERDFLQIFLSSHPLRLAKPLE